MARGPSRAAASMARGRRFMRGRLPRETAGECPAAGSLLPSPPAPREPAMATAVRAAGAVSGSNAAMRLFLPRPTYLAIPLLFAGALPSQSLTPAGSGPAQRIWAAREGEFDELWLRRTFEVRAPAAAA